MCARVAGIYDRDARRLERPKKLAAAGIAMSLYSSAFAAAAILGAVSAHALTNAPQGDYKSFLTE
jgi:hypothetical protein